MASVNRNVMSSFYVLALARISLGFIFLWAFLDKLLGLGFSTCRVAATGVVSRGCSLAWVHGGSPTTGFLSHATGPFASFYHNLAGHAWVDYAFMALLLVIGLGLLFGVAMRMVTVLGSFLLLAMWSALLWPANNPLLDEHIVYILLLVVLYLTNSQQKWGCRDWWVRNTKKLFK